MLCFGVIDSDVLCLFEEWKTVYLKLEQDQEL